MTAHSDSMMLLAGDASGDVHAAKLVTALQAQHPTVSYFGMAGKYMRAAGVEAIIPTENLNMVGVVEVLCAASKIWRTKKALQAALLARKPNLVILVDFSGFNLRFAKWIKSQGDTKIVYYIPPQLWASRPKRMRYIQRYVDEVAFIFPFEKTLYESAGVSAHYVGHPLVSAIENAPTYLTAKQALGFSETQSIIGLLPGSRVGEVKALLPEMLAAANLYWVQHPNTEFVLPVAKSLDFKWVAEYCAQSGLPIQCVKRPTIETLPACDACWVASGTASLEVAWLGIPAVLVYKVHPITYWIARWVMRAPYLGIANIMLNKSVMPELIQSQVNGQALFENLEAVLDSNVSASEDAMTLKALFASPKASNLTHLVSNLLEVND